MCGIVGLLSGYTNGATHREMEVFEDLLYVDALRGFDSTGAFSIANSGNFDWAKGAVAPYSFLRSKQWESLKSTAIRDASMVFGHNRKATEGTVNNENAHPFVVGNTILIHNGSLTNWRSLIRHEKREKLGIEVDSHAIAYLFEHEDFTEVLKEVKGAFVFVWYNAQDKILRIARNEERPLHYGKDSKNGNCFFLASEFTMLKAIANRRMNTEIKEGGMFKSHVVHEYGIPKAGGWEYQGTRDIYTKKLYAPYVNREEGKGAEEPPKSVIPTPTPTACVPVSGNVLKLPPPKDGINFEKTAPIPQNHLYVPSQYVTNWYYGEREFGTSVRPYERTIFMIDDYEYVKGSNDHFIFTGFVCGNTYAKVNVKGHWKGVEEDLLSLVGVQPMKAFIRRVTKDDKSGELWLTVQSTDKAEVIQMANGEFMEKGHFLDLLKEQQGRCACGINLDKIKTEEIRRPSDFNYFFCKDCDEIDVTPQQQLLLGTDNE